jgi:hypothetical protein
MEANPYEAPRADLTTVESSQQPLYVVSTKKFWIMMVTTLGLYSVYWFYRNWKQYKLAVRDDVWPIPRAIFNIFFTHSLCRFVSDRIRRDGISYDWSPGAIATTYVVFVLIERVADRMNRGPNPEVLLDIAGIVALFAAVLMLWRIQLAINVACHDGRGESNDHLSAANYAWMAVGLVLVALFIVGTFFVTP